MATRAVASFAITPPPPPRFPFFNINAAFTGSSKYLLYFDCFLPSIMIRVLILPGYLLGGANAPFLNARVWG